jgi:hypothetical protein
MKLSLIELPEGVKFKTECDGVMARFNPNVGTDMCIMTSKLIGLDSQKGYVERGIHLDNCRVSYGNGKIDIQLDGNIELLKSKTIDPSYVANFTIIGETAKPMSMKQLYVELNRRVEKIRAAIEVYDNAVKKPVEYAIGSFDDVQVDVNRWL